MSLPNDPAMLLSYVNTQLRDHYSSLTELALSLNVSSDDIVKKLAAINYSYDSQLNKFI